MEIGDPKAMFNPKTVALIGASDKAGSVGRAILENLILLKAGKIFPVNPNRKEVLGFPCYPSVASISEHIDLGVIATPATGISGVIEECGKKGVQGIVIISAGFKEIGEEGKRLEKEIKEIRERYHMRLMVTQYGMSDRMGLVSYEQAHQPMFLPERFTPSKTYGETKANQIDDEISRVIEEAHERVRKILSEHRKVLDEVAHLLLEKEVVQGLELRKMLGKAPSDTVKD